jgi:biotin carboxylase
VKQRVAFLFPTQWDRRQLDACRARWQDDFEPVFLGPDDGEVGADFDVEAFVADVARTEGPRLAGVTSASDYPGAVAAALLAERLGRPGASPRAVLLAGHKGESRRLQAAALPEATPRHVLLDPARPDDVPRGLAFPCFVKPVRGSFSVLARVVESAADLRAFLAHPSVREHAGAYARIHRTLQKRLAPDAPDPGAFLAEELLHGAQTTVEGWVHRGEVGVLGIVDSVMVPGTRAFARFETPSALPAEVQRRMAAAARQVVLASGLDGTAWNVEFTWDAARGAVHVIEVNPRLCGQFGDVWQDVTGVNGYEHALALAVGERPADAPARGPSRFAASVPLRTFEPVRVERAPTPARVDEVERAHPGTRVWWECRAGDELAGFDEAGEGQGYRYAVLNVGADSRAGLVEQARAVEAALGARLVPLERRAGRAR